MSRIERLRAWRDSTGWHHVLMANGWLWWMFRQRIGFRHPREDQQ